MNDEKKLDIRHAQSIADFLFEKFPCGYHVMDRFSHSNGRNNILHIGKELFYYLSSYRSFFERDNEPSMLYFRQYDEEEGNPLRYGLWLDGVKNVDGFIEVINMFSSLKFKYIHGIRHVKIDDDNDYDNGYYYSDYTVFNKKQSRDHIVHNIDVIRKYASINETFYFGIHCIDNIPENLSEISDDHILDKYFYLRMSERFFDKIRHLSAEFVIKDCEWFREKCCVSCHYLIYIGAIENVYAFISAVKKMNGHSERIQLFKPSINSRF